MDNFFEIRAMNYFWGHLQKFNFSEIVPRNVYDQGIMKESCSLCDKILGHGCGKGIPPPRIRTFRKFGCLN